MANLRLRLLFFLILVVVPLLGLNLYTTIQARRELEREARQNAMRLAELISANQELHFEHTYQLLLTISLLLESQVNNNIDCRKVILNLMAPQYANLGVLGPDRALACSSVPVSSAEVRPQPEFRHAIENEGPVIGGSQTIRGRPVLNVFYPMGKSSGKVPGFAFAALDLMWIKHLAASQLPAGSSFNLVDERGTFLVGSPTIEKMILSHEPVIQEILKNSKRVAFTTFQTDRSLHLVAFAPINGFTGQKLFVAIETVRQQPAFTSGLPSTFGSTALVILALLVIAAGWSAGDYFIVREIRSLLKTAQSLSVGELTARAPVPANGGELTELACSVNYLADSLQRCEAEAKIASQKADCQRARQNALHEINLAITSTLDLTSILGALLEKIDLLLPYSAASVRLYDPATGRLEAFACRNVDENAWKAIPWRAGLGLPNAAFDSKAPLIVADAQIDPRTMNPVFFRKQNIVSNLGVPLLAKDERLGVLSFYTKYEHRFTPDEVDFLTVLAGQAAVAIQNSQLFARTRQQAVELGKANKIKNEFLAVMSHELRTPLNIIMNSTDVLKSKLFGDFSEPQGKVLDKVSRQSHELLYMIDKILEVAQLQSGSVYVDRQKVDLTDFFSSLKAGYGEALEKAVEVRWQAPVALPVIETDGVKLRYILNQLINNAIKFTDQGFVMVSAHVVSQEQESAVEFVIEDTGIGIAEECVPSIFEKFHQNDASDTRPYGGIGVGLYLAKTYATLIGGDISVESKPGRGSTFRVRLPIQQV